MGPQKGFRITASGAEELAGWLRTPPDLSSPPRDELVIKVLVALRIPGVNVHEVVQVHRRYLVELMQQWTRLKEDEADYDLNLALVVDAELFRLDWVYPVAGLGRRPSSGPPPTRSRLGHDNGDRHRPYRACGAGLEQGDERAGNAARRAPTAWGLPRCMRCKTST